jgi:phosphomannomutase
MRLKISVSGVRGVVGETLTPHLLVNFAQAFGTYVGEGRVLIGRDTRLSGQMVTDAVVAGLLATGCTPVDLGVLPIPALMLRCSRRPDVQGGVAVTASHNPAEWNALKLLSGHGLFLNHMQANALLDIYHQGTFHRVAGEEVTRPEYDEDAVDAHLDAVISEVDVSAIRRAGLAVAVDCVNGAGAEATPQLLSRLNCKTLRIGCQPSGHFHRPPEPLPANLEQLARTVENNEGIQVGFAQDADADRLALVDGTGRALSGDVMLAVLVDLVLRRQKGPVVVNLSTSSLVDWVADRHSVEVIRTPVGEANVVEAILAHDAVVGGESSGGLIYPRIHTCRDSFIGMALVLEYLARGELTLAELVGRLPRLEMIRDKLPLSSTLSRRLMARLRDKLADGDLDLRDGVKAHYGTSWVHVRPSNTEPIVRLIVEAQDRKVAEDLRDRVQSVVHEVQQEAR